jgi:spore coat-associated protein N
VSRLHALAARPRRSLAALAIVLAAVGVTAGSGANFTARAANPSNTFATGTLSMAATPGGAVLSAPGLKPGDARSGTVDIENTGSLSGEFTLSTSNPSDSSPSLLGQLDLVVSDCGVWSGGAAPSCAGATQVYSGKVDAIGTKALGAFAAGDKHRYRFTVTLPSSTGDNYQGKSASVQFDWDATA